MKVFWTILKVFRWIGRWVWRSFELLRKMMHMVFLLVLFALITAALSYREKPLPQQAALVLNLRGALT
ncbi:MAG: hypothetical protein HKM24_02100, partial [Gammaproteobacteria bacterium]|nr:hypothetical protein [Gammaproteobacteria bacterium]